MCLNEQIIFVSLHFHFFFHNFRSKCSVSVNFGILHDIALVRVQDLVKTIFHAKPTNVLQLWRCHICWYGLALAAPTAKNTNRILHFALAKCIPSRFAYK